VNGRRRILVAVLGALLVLPGAARAAPGVSVSVDRARISTRLGHTFEFRTTIANDGRTTASGLIAHLNVLSLRDGVYVDPEDWSSHRTRYLAPIAAEGSRTIAWRMQAVNSGSFGVYVAVLPRSGGPRPPVTGPTLRVSVAKRRTLNSGGILPLALGIPGLLGVLAVGVSERGRSRRRWRRRADTSRAP
jgi:hypothetical protein